MRITEHIQNANGKTLFSFEVIPPQKGSSINDLYKNIDPLMEFKPPFIDVTTSREEYIFIEKENGLFEKKITRKRPGTIGICASLQHKYGVDTVPHILCGGFNKEETEYALIECQYLGIQNIMALRGDSRKDEQYFKAHSEGHPFASDLVKQIKDLNSGKFLHEEIEVAENMDFCIGVAGYPEKHLEAPSLNYDLQMLKQKVENGADYIVTQMFFDNQKFFDFVKACRDNGIDVPIIPGLKPITTKKQLSFLPRIFHVDIPTDLSTEIMKCKTDEDCEKVGTEWLVQQSKDLKAFGVPVLHYYTLGKARVIADVVKELV